jgi:hypothetical protein
MLPPELLDAPRWPGERLRAIRGQVRGAVLRDWSANVARRFGPLAVGELRARTGLPPSLLPDLPGSSSWLPAWVQLAVTDDLLENQLASRAAGLLPLLREDVLQALGPARRLGPRLLGPAGLLRHAAAAHRETFDLGQLRGEVEARTATLTWTGAELFGNPTWRLLQASACVIALELGGARPRVGLGTLTDESCSLNLAW